MLHEVVEYLISLFLLISPSFFEYKKLLDTREMASSVLWGKLSDEEKAKVDEISLLVQSSS